MNQTPPSPAPKAQGMTAPRAYWAMLSKRLAADLRMEAGASRELDENDSSIPVMTDAAVHIEYLEVTIDSLTQQLAQARAEGAANFDDAKAYAGIAQVWRESCEALETALRLVLPMAKGYANAHRVGSNAEYIEAAEVSLRPRNWDQSGEKATAFLSELSQARAQVDAWTETARLAHVNEAFWRGIVHQTGRILGGRVYTQDDDGTVDEPLALRVPEVAAELKAELSQATAHETELLAICDRRATLIGETTERAERAEAGLARLIGAVQKAFASRRWTVSAANHQHMHAQAYQEIEGIIEALRPVTGESA